MRTRYLTSLALVVLAGCAGKTSGTEKEGPGSVYEQKVEAANDLAQGTASGDPCKTNQWYGDGTCDSFCPGADTDCLPDGDSVVCTMFSETSDGACGRDAGDPCIFQDPDCGMVTPDDPGVDDPDEPVACALLLEESDGKCTRADDDPCRGQDPDCDVACVTMDEPSDGVCHERPPSRCGGYDPDCGVVCPAIYEMPDGVCQDRGNDPCGQDPDCTMPRYECDTSFAFCDMVPPTCPPGQTISVAGGCYGPCVPVEQCMPACNPNAAGAPGMEAADVAVPSDGVCMPTRCGGYDPDCGVACDAYLEVPDGACSRPSSDPCIFQDPDCNPMGGGTDPGVACAEYIEEADGMCRRSPDDPCIFQDPDCAMTMPASPPEAR
jgi:hypothetical protein